MTGDGSKVQCYKEQYCTGTSNVRSMELVKHKMTNVNIDSLVISELEWENFTQVAIISTTVGMNPLEEMEWPS